MAKPVYISDDPPLFFDLETLGQDVAALIPHILENPDQMPVLLQGATHKKARIRYPSTKLLHEIAKAEPELVYPYFQEIREIMFQGNQILRWYGLAILGELCRVDTKNQFEPLVDQLLEFFLEPGVITVDTVIQIVPTVVASKPAMLPVFLEKLLGVDEVPREPMRMAHVAGTVLKVLPELLSLIDDLQPVIEFAEGHLHSSMGATQKKAKALLKRIKSI